MKVPMKWLREYTHIALDAQDYAQKMVHVAAPAWKAWKRRARIFPMWSWAVW